MLDLNILKLMFKEEFRLQASFFNRSYFLFSSLTIVLFTFIMGATLPMLRRAVAIDDLLLVAHWVLLFYGLAVGGFAMFGDRILERRFGSVSLLLASGYTLPIRFRRLFFLFYIKDTLYYIFFTILPMVLGLALASVFAPISFSSLLFLFVSLTMSFLIGISISVLLFSVLARMGGVVMVIVAACGSYLWFMGIDVKEVASQLPSLVFYHSHSFYIVLEVLIVSLALGALSSLFIMFTVSVYVGSVLAYLTGLFTNSYLLDAKILLLFSLAVVPVLLAETRLSFYYPVNSNTSTIYIAGLGLILVAASIIFLNRLGDRWKGKLFRIA